MAGFNRFEHSLAKPHSRGAEIRSFKAGGNGYGDLGIIPNYPRRYVYFQSGRRRAEDRRSRRGCFMGVNEFPVSIEVVFFFYYS